MMVDIKYKRTKLSSAIKAPVNRLDYSRAGLWSQAGVLGRILGEKRFYELAKAENKTSVETSEIDIALSALKVSDIDARAHGLNDYEIAVARDWARLIRTKSRRGILCYKTGNQRLNLIFNNPGTKR
jgi:hypothetical protein